jgi:hypothetical protein
MKSALISNRTSGDPLKLSVDLFLPLCASDDHSIVPHAHDALSFQDRQMFAQLYSVAFVCMRVRYEGRNWSRAKPLLRHPGKHYYPPLVDHAQSTFDVAHRRRIKGAEGIRKTPLKNLPLSVELSELR